MTDTLLIGFATFSFLGMILIFFRKTREISHLSENQIQEILQALGSERGFFKRRAVNVFLMILHSSEKLLRKFKILALRFDNFFSRQILKLKSKSTELRHPSSYFKDIHLWKKDEYQKNNETMPKKNREGISLKDIIDIEPINPAAKKYLEEFEKRKK
ncbi:MAG: hypothetical protein HYV52_00110 [Parcubacteria group bacterium]|nr:hypothetical protein [Parcubacteria group bacterium]